MKHDWVLWSLSVIVGLLVVFAVGLVIHEVTRPDNTGQTNLLTTTPEGCKVYKVGTGRSHIYTTTCPGKVEWRESCGKNCVRDVEVPTNER